MRKLESKDLKGKKIKDVDTNSLNVVRLIFEDNTCIDIWAEQAVFTQAGAIPGFFVEDSKGQ